MHVPLYSERSSISQATGFLCADRAMNPSNNTKAIFIFYTILMVKILQIMRACLPSSVNFLIPQIKEKPKELPELKIPVFYILTWKNKQDLDTMRILFCTFFLALLPQLWEKSGTILDFFFNLNWKLTICVHLDCFHQCVIYTKQYRFRWFLEWWLRYSIKYTPHSWQLHPGSKQSEMQS